MSKTKKTKLGKHFTLTLVALTLALTGSFMGSNRAYAAAGITAESVELGETTTITVSGCQPTIQDSPVSIVIVDGGGETVDTRNMSSETALWTAPNPGDYTVTVTCKGTGGAADSSASAKFSVTMTPITVSPATWKAGTQVTLSAAGYQPGEAVYIGIVRCSPADTSCGSEFYYKEWETTADASGKLNFPLQVPTSLPAEKWYFKVAAVKSNLRRWSPTVTTTATPTALDMYPGTWAAGTKVNLLASGFKIGETVNVAIVAAPNCAAGSVCANLGTTFETLSATADWTGRLNESIAIPSQLEPGKWAIVATGKDSKTKRTSPVVQTPQIDVTPADWKAGTKVTLAVAGFTPGESVTVSLWGYNACPSGGLGACPPLGEWKSWATKADAKGAITFSVEVPANTPAGRWNFHALGKDSNTELQSMITTLDPVKLDVSPASWKAGSRLAVKAGGFQPGETVLVQLAGEASCPDYTSPECPNTLPWKTWTGTADGNGDFATTIDVPANIPAGTWAIYATGKTSEIRRVSGVTRLTSLVLQVAPGAWKAGTKVSLLAAGLTPGESVTLKIVGLKGCGKGSTCSTTPTTWKTWKTTGVVDSSGEWRYTLQVPKDLPAGQWDLVATGNKSGIERRTSTVAVAGGLPPTGD